MSTPRTSWLLNTRGAGAMSAGFKTISLHRKPPPPLNPAANPSCEGSALLRVVSQEDASMYVISESRRLAAIQEPCDTELKHPSRRHTGISGIAQILRGTRTE